MKKTNQSGFTLIELMISLVLGLLISAAAVQIYMANVKTSTFQKSGSELQDASVFGLQQLESHIRIANLGNPTNSITDLTDNGGIVLTGLNLGIYSTATDAATGITSQTDTYENVGLLTRTTGDDKTPPTSNGWTGLSNITNVESDQLTIQYINVTGSDMLDCESRIVEPNKRVVERYFLRSASGDNKVTLLACDSGRVEKNPSKPDELIITDFGDAGQEKIMNVDQFKVLLGTQTAATKDSTGKDVPSQMSFITSRDYMALKTVPKPPITSVKIGLIVSGSTAVMGSDGTKTNFTLFNQTNAIKDPTTNGRDKKIRNVYETTVLLRNARVV